MAQAASMVVASWTWNAGRKAPVGQLHDAGVGVGDGHTWGRVLGADLLLGCGLAAHGRARVPLARNSRVWAGGNARSDAPADEYGST